MTYSTLDNHSKSSPSPPRGTLQISNIAPCRRRRSTQNVPFAGKLFMIWSASENSGDFPLGSIPPVVQAHASSGDPAEI